jgi:hypothetical protein
VPKPPTADREMALTVTRTFVTPTAIASHIEVSHHG